MNAFVSLYPNLQKFDGLPEALRHEFSTIAPNLQIEGHNFEELNEIFKELGMVIHLPCLVKADDRWARVDIAVEKRLFILEIGEATETLAFIELDTLARVVKLIYVWMIEKVSIPNLSAIDPVAIIINLADDRQYILWQWKKRERSAYNGASFTGMLAPLITEAMKDPILGQLTPYTSHDYLHFSRCTDYPYSGDCPDAEPVLSIDVYRTYTRQDTEYAKRLLQKLPSDYGVTVKNRGDFYEVLDSHQNIIAAGDILTALGTVIEKTYGLYRVFDVYSRGGKLLGIGDTQTTINLLKQALPPNCGMAIRGSEYDL
jgi:hypothetical protein